MLRAAWVPLPATLAGRLACLHTLIVPRLITNWVSACCCRFHWEITEARRGDNVLGMADPKLLMLAPGVQLFTDTEQSFLEAAKQVGGRYGLVWRRSMRLSMQLAPGCQPGAARRATRFGAALLAQTSTLPPPCPVLPLQLLRLAGMIGRQLVMPNPPCDSMWVGLVANPDYPHPWLPLWRYNYDGLQARPLPASWRQLAPAWRQPRWSHQRRLGCRRLGSPRMLLLTAAARLPLAPSCAWSSFAQGSCTARRLPALVLLQPEPGTFCVLLLATLLRRLPAAGPPADRNHAARR